MKGHVSIVPIKKLRRIFDRRLLIIVAIFLFGIWLLWKGHKKGNHAFMDRVFVENPKFSSLISNLPYVANAELIISDVYDTIKFHLNSIIPPTRPIKNNEIIKMFIVPHSHNDPGWMYTFTQYFRIYTNSILRNAAEYMDIHEKMRFIYAEICFVDLFFSANEIDKREMFKKHIKEGRIEIVTGGWVQPDEANTLLFPLVMQLMEGHEWIRNHIGVIPKNHWTIDPFGHSPTLTYLVKLAGLKRGVLNRVHYELLKRFGEEQNLEFDWRPSWTKSKQLDFRSHVMPYGHYDSARSCGPDFSVCCRLDFIKLISGQNCITEFGGKAIVSMENEALTQMANYLARQVKLKSALYKHNSVFLQIGEDFRYSDVKEWKLQEENFQAIFNYFDLHPELGVKGQFGTLNDYFESVENSKQFEVSTLSGDFYTYSDRDDHYWSGYYTSRPYFKQLDRTLQSFVHAADILFSFASMSHILNDVIKLTFPLLVQARRDLSLFAHHDGVTGTSEPNVMLDYGQRLIDGINSTKTVISNVFNRLIGVSDISCIEVSNRLKVVEETTLNGSKTLIVFNQLAHPIQEVVCLKTSSLLKVTLMSQPNFKVSQQIGPFIELKDKKLRQSESTYELCFMANIDGLSFETYRLEISDKSVLKNQIIRPDKIKETFQLENEYIRANFESKFGLLQSITDKKHGVEHKFQMQFISYGSRPTGTKKTTGSDSVSGAYLFLPDKVNLLKPHTNDILILKGQIRSSVYIHISEEYSLLQRITLNGNEDVIRINNLLDIKSVTKNIEIGMQIQTDSKLNQFYTDLNGFELTRRRRYDSLPLHGQFYPMPSAAILQDDKTRISLLSRQPHGVGNIIDGQLQVMLDRRLDQNDDRGDLQPITDNLPTESEFIMLIESFHKTQINSKNTIAYHSLKAHHYSLKMDNYPITMISSKQPKSIKKSFLFASLPCDVHLLALRTSTSPTNFDDNSEVLSVVPLNSSALVLQKLGWEHYFGVSKHCLKVPDTIKPGRMFSTKLKRVSNVSLTMLYNYGEVDLNREISLTPMQISTFRLDY